MKFICAVLVCLFCLANLIAQPEKGEFDKTEKEKKVIKLALAREDKDGNIEENPEVFSPTDIPIFCYVDLNTTDPTLVKLNFIAVKVKGMRPNSKIISTQYKTKDGEDAVTFTGKPEKKWVIGKYRVDIYLDGKLAEKKEFVVK